MLYATAVWAGWLLATAWAVQAPKPKAAAPMFPPIAQLLGSESAAGKTADFDALVARLHSPDPAARQAAVAALGAPDNVRAVPYLGGLLLQINEPLDLRVSAAMALGRIRTWRAGVFLKQSMRDSAKEVRFASALALGKSKASETLPLLTETLEKDPEWWVRFAAAVGLGDNRDPAAVAALGRAALGEKEWQVRMQAVHSLGQIGSRDAAYALERPLRDSDGAVRAAAAMALGDIGGPDSLNLLATALHDETEDFPRQVMSDTVKKLLAKP